jgi:hypothetical protein
MTHEETSLFHPGCLLNTSLVKRINSALEHLVFGTHSIATILDNIHVIETVIMIKVKQKEIPLVKYV